MTSNIEEHWLLCYYENRGEVKMTILVNSVEECYPSLEALDELGISYEVMQDGKVAIKTDKVRVAENHDATRKSIDESSPLNDPSLSYFVIEGHRIVASGNLTAAGLDNYVCEGPFRVYSRTNVTTLEYISAGQVTIEELHALNERMLQATEKTDTPKL